MPSSPAIPNVNGQYLIDLVNGLLGGYQNAVNTDVILALLNEGKNEVWMILKNLRADWFIQKTQNADSTQNNYFGPMNTATREYALPKDFQEMKFIEVLDTGYEDVSFVYRDMASAVWKELRRGSTNSPSGSQANLAYHYDIVGKNQLVLAEYPEFNFQQVVLWYVRVIPDFSAADPIDEIVYPYVNKIAFYAAKLAMLPLQDQPMYAAWKEEWKESVVRIASSADPRQISDTVFVDSFDGTPEDSDF